jgi:hypothetical protein
MNERAQRHGGSVDPTSDLARVFRLVGTQNWKIRANPSPVRILIDNITFCYTPSDVDEHLIEVSKAEQSQTSASHSRHSEEGRKTSLAELRDAIDHTLVAGVKLRGIARTFALSEDALF